MAYPYALVFDAHGAAAARPGARWGRRQEAPGKVRPAGRHQKAVCIAYPLLLDPTKLEQGRDIIEGHGLGDQMGQDVRLIQGNVHPHGWRKHPGMGWRMHAGNGARDSELKAGEIGHHQVGGIRARHHDDDMRLEDASSFEYGRIGRASCRERV